MWIMKKIFLILVFLVAFNAMFFLLCDNKNMGVWISYGFVHFAFLLLLIMPLLGTKGKGTFILNAAVYTQAIYYFICELIAGSIFMVLQFDHILWPLLVQGVLWLVYMTVILINAWANDNTQKSLQERERDLRPVQDCIARLKLLSLRVKDAEMRKDVMACYNELYYSATRQNQASEQIDAEIGALISGLDTELRQNDDADMVKRYVEQLHNLIRERKEILKYSQTN